MPRFSLLASLMVSPRISSTAWLNGEGITPPQQLHATSTTREENSRLKKERAPLQPGSQDLNLNETVVVFSEDAEEDCRTRLPQPLSPGIAASVRWQRAVE